MNSTTNEPHGTIIESVKTPLGFLVLGFLIVDGTVAALALSLEAFREPLVWTVIVSIPVFVLIVVVLAIWRPEALKGSRPLQDSHAHQFASDLFIALDGALSNLEPLEREEAWLMVADVITSDVKADSSYREFCESVSEKLKKLTNLTNRTIKARGVINQS